jgi:hypothetical protein
MKINNFVNYLIKADKIIDYIPIISTLSNSIDILGKIYLNKSDVQLNDYSIYLKNKKFKHCLILMIPIFGNIFIFIKSLKKNKEIDYCKELEGTSQNHQESAEFLNDMKEQSAQFQAKQQQHRLLIHQQQKQQEHQQQLLIQQLLQQPQQLLQYLLHLSPKLLLLQLQHLQQDPPPPPPPPSLPINLIELQKLQALKLKAIEHLRQRLQQLQQHPQLLQMPPQYLSQILQNYQKQILDYELLFQDQD